MQWFSGRSARSGRRFGQRRCIFESLEPRLALSGTPPTITDVTVCGTDWSEDFLSYLEAHSLGTDGYSIPVGSSEQSAPLPWENLDLIRITFSEDVDVQMADLALSGVDTTTYQFSGFFYDAQSYVATWTLNAALADDRLLIDVDANGIDPVRDMDGNILDGEWQDEVSTYSSGNSTEGGDFEFCIRVLPGDANQSATVTYSDYIGTSALVGKSSSDQGYNPLCDIDGDASIESADQQDVLSFLWDQTPSGSPVGVDDDAPTTTGIESVDIDDDAVDVAISLWDAFDDVDDSDSQLTYAIVSNSNAALFDTVSINAATGILTLNSAANVSGRSTLSISATDPDGLSVRTLVSADVDYNNQAPVISNYVAAYQGSNAWNISGSVSDSDDDVTGWLVVLYGAIETRATVQSDGTFELTVAVLPDDWGDEECITYDPHGLASNIPFVDIGLT